MKLDENKIQPLSSIQAHCNVATQLMRKCDEILKLELRLHSALIKAKATGIGPLEAIAACCKEMEEERRSAVDSARREFDMAYNNIRNAGDAIVDSIQILQTGSDEDDHYAARWVAAYGEKCDTFAKMVSALQLGLERIPCDSPKEQQRRVANVALRLAHMFGGNDADFIMFGDWSSKDYFEDFQRDLNWLEDCYDEITKINETPNWPEGSADDAPKSKGDDWDWIPDEIDEN